MFVGHSVMAANRKFKVGWNSLSPRFNLLKTGNSVEGGIYLYKVKKRKHKLQENECLELEKTPIHQHQSEIWSLLNSLIKSISSYYIIWSVGCPSKLTDLLFGTSGWSYKDWVGPFYEKASKMFSHYFQYFNTVEVNSTFYRYPSEAMIYGLSRTAPKNFIFSVKIPRLITHEKRLDLSRKIRNDLLRFLELLEPLNKSGRLGCLLIQLPPSFIYDQDVESLESFLKILPGAYEFAVEFRDHSWVRDDTWQLLKKNNVAYCIVDEPLLPPEVHVTANFAYFRWHGRGMRPWYNYCYLNSRVNDI